MGPAVRMIKRLGRTGAGPQDLLLAVSLTVLTEFAGTTVHAPHFRPFTLVAYALTVLVNLPLALRRRWPMSVALTSSAACLLFLALGYLPATNLLGPLLGVFTVAAVRPFRTVLPFAALGFAVWVYSGLLVPLALYIAVPQGALVVAVAWLFGTRTRQLTERNQRLAVLTGRLRQEQENQARRAVAEERLRIARELHDVVAHHMSVISVHAGLAQYLADTDPPAVAASLDTIVDTSAEGLDELRRLLHVLRFEEPEEYFDPAPLLVRVSELAERMIAVGVTVRVVVAGTHRTLAPGLEQCAYRVVQESLTNVLKHARPARATVSLRYAPEDLVVRIADEGRAPVSAAAPTGHGLTGMRERAGLYGGTVAAGPRPRGGFEVAMTLPTAP